MEGDRVKSSVANILFDLIHLGDTDDAPGAALTCILLAIGPVVLELCLWRESGLTWDAWCVR